MDVFNVRGRGGVMLAISMLVFVASGIASAATIDCPSAGRCEGTDGDDSLIGTEIGDRIFGRQGDDKLEGRGGRDLLNGGPGTDYLRGGPGDDRLLPGQGHDHLRGQRGDDYLRADVASDLGPYWYQRVDNLKGGPGADELYGNLGDHLHGGPGPDRLFGSHYSEYLNGGRGDDVLNGRVETEKGTVDRYIFSSRFGNDKIIDSPAHGISNILDLRDVEEDLEVFLNATANRAEVRSTDGKSTIDWAENAINDMWAGGGDDIIRGDERQNRIKVGSDGDDIVYGGAGKDRIGARDRPGAPRSSDTIYGGPGNDRIDVTDVGIDGEPDTVDCGAGDADRVMFDPDVDIVTNCEILEPQA